MAAVFGMGIDRLVEGVAHTARLVEAPGDPERADGVQSVRVLQDTRFQAAGCDPGGEAVRLDGVGHGPDPWPEPRGCRSSMRPREGR